MHSARSRWLGWFLGLQQIARYLHQLSGAPWNIQIAFRKSGSPGALGFPYGHRAPCRVQNALSAFFGKLQLACHFRPHQLVVFLTRQQICFLVFLAVQQHRNCWLLHPEYWHVCPFCLADRPDWSCNIETLLLLSPQDSCRSEEGGVSKSPALVSLKEARAPHDVLAEPCKLC